VNAWCSLSMDGRSTVGAALAALTRTAGRTAEGTRGLCDGCTGSDVRSKYRNPSQRRQRQHAQHPLARWTTAAWRCCGREPRHIAARRLRLDAKADAVLAARAAGVSQWAELLPQFLQQVLEYLEWDHVACAAIRAVCSTWCTILDALLPRLQPRGSLAVMEGKLG
jgi:hypothetical protein